MKRHITNTVVLFVLLMAFRGGAILPSTSASSFADEPRGYKHTGRLKLQFTYNWSISHESVAPKSLEMWIPRISNHSNPTMTGTAPIQSSQVLSNTTNMIPDVYYYDPQDDYNNSIEYFSVTVNPGEEFQYSIVYNLTLRETDWTIRESEEGDYDVDDPVYQNLTGAEPHLEVNNPTLVSLSNSICEGKNSIKDKVNAVVNWMNDNLEFNGGRPSQGAYLTYIVGGGDCSDFATFFVTMLRIQGIPARKCVGMQLWNMEKQEMYHNLKVGQEFSYSSYNLAGAFQAGIPGHAWAEYYIPNYGFVSLDPTFVRSNKLKYMNFMDYTYVLSSIGENIGGGFNPALASNLIEWAIIPYIPNPTTTNWALSLMFTVLETEGLLVLPEWSIMIIVGGSASLVASTIYLLIRRRRKMKSDLALKIKIKKKKEV